MGSQAKKNPPPPPPAQGQKTNATLGTTRGVASTASGGGSREDPVAYGGNWDAQQFRAQEYAKHAAQAAMSMMGMYGGYGYGGYGGYDGGYGGYGYEQGNYGYSEPAQDTTYIEYAASQIEAMTQVGQTTLDQIPPELLSTLPQETLLRFAFSPEDMQALDLSGEHDAIAEVRDVLTVNNPTKEVMEHLLKSGQFKDVVWSGHGNDKGLWITNAEGKAELMPADQIATMFQDSGVQEVLLNTCNGGGQVDDALNDAGVDTFAYNRTIDDTEAERDAAVFADKGELAAVQAQGTDGLHSTAAGAAATKALMASLAGMDFSNLWGFDFSGLINMGTGVTAPEVAPEVTAQAATTPDTGMSADVGASLGSVASHLGDTGNTYAPPDQFVDYNNYHMAGLQYGYNLY